MCPPPCQTVVVTFFTIASIGCFDEGLKPQYDAYAKKYGANAFSLDDWLRKYHENYKMVSVHGVE